MVRVGGFKEDLPDGTSAPSRHALPMGVSWDELRVVVGRRRRRQLGDININVGFAEYRVAPYNFAGEIVDSDSASDVERWARANFDDVIFAAHFPTWVGRKRTRERLGEEID